MSETIAVVSVSGGKDSQETANRAIDKYGTDRVRIVMADTGNDMSGRGGSVARIRAER